jgi:hypothetical protein
VTSGLTLCVLAINGREKPANVFAANRKYLISRDSGNYEQRDSFGLGVEMEDPTPDIR